MRLIFVMSAAALLAACVAQGGVRVGDAQLDALERGRSRYRDVLAALGPPGVATAAPDGARILIYKSERLKVRAATLLPLIGSIAGGTEEENSWVTFFFDRAGVLTDWSVERERKLHRAF